LLKHLAEGLLYWKIKKNLKGGYASIIVPKKV
jgi:hypothetical protein